MLMPQQRQIGQPRQRSAGNRLGEFAGERETPCYLREFDIDQMRCMQRLTGTQHARRAAHPERRSEQELERD